MTTLGNALEFDVREVNEAADKIKRPGRFIAAAGVVMMAGFSILFAASDSASIIDGTISFSRLVAAVAIWVVTAVIAWVGVPSVILDRKGASRIRLTDAEIEILYPSGRVVSWSWADSELSLDLREWDSQPEKAIIVQGTQSALTQEAYSAILSVAEAKGLVTGADRGYWTIPSSIRPFVRHIRGSTRAAQ